MSAAKRVERLPEELFLAESFRLGRAVKTSLSLKAIGDPDYRFQAREESAPGQPLDLGHVSRLQALLKDVGDLYPIVVFHNPARGRHLIADGFHRFEAYRREGRDSIPAYQVEGDESDALDYCTSCNRLALLIRSRKDIRKAVQMLLAEDHWFRREDKDIATHVGCGPITVSSARRAFCEDKGIPVPTIDVQNPYGGTTYGVPNYPAMSVPGGVHLAELLGRSERGSDIVGIDLFDGSIRGRRFLAVIRESEYGPILDLVGALLVGATLIDFPAPDARLIIVSDRCSQD